MMIRDGNRENGGRTESSNNEHGKLFLFFFFKKKKKKQREKKKKHPFHPFPNIPTKKRFQIKKKKKNILCYFFIVLPRAPGAVRENRSIIKFLSTSHELFHLQILQQR